MLQYLLSVTAIWLISLVLFDIFLKKENYHNYNRFFLLFTFLLGLILPLWDWINGGSRYMATLNQWIASVHGLTQWLSVIYVAGASVALSLLLIDIVKLVLLYRTGNRSEQDGWTIVETGQEHPPFSYLDILFVAELALYSPEEWTMITTHEKQHSILLHLIDSLIMQLSRIILWFHPLVYIYNTRLLLVHEYQADRSSSPQPQEYGRFLVDQAMMQPAPSLSHSFNRSPIKNRIVMLSKNGTPRTGAANLKQLMLVLPLTIFMLFFFTKNSYSESKVKPAATVWKKKVTRMIDFREKEDTMKHHLNDANSDKAILELMAEAVNNGKISAYSTWDNEFKIKLTKEQFSRLFTTRTDTAILKDPVTGEQITKVIRFDFDYSLIHKYRILEEWTFDASTGKTNIETLGICPMKDIFNDDGAFRGVQGMFWLHYKDANAAIANYEVYHPDNTLATHIWNDYFGPDTTNMTRP